MFQSSLIQVPNATAFMLRNNKTGLYYCKGSSGYKRRNAAIWPTKHGAAAAKGHMKPTEKPDWDYIEFELVEKRVQQPA